MKTGSLPFCLECQDKKDVYNYLDLKIIAASDSADIKGLLFQ